MKKGLIALLAVACLAACKKDKGDTEKPTITIMTPTANQQFTPGQVVNISATITDNDGLHEIHLFVTNKASGADVVHMAQHVDVKTYNLNNTFTAGAGITYVLKFAATDHSGNHTESQLEVKAN
jgi:uncharacterized lipoprotein YbaY